ncbi:hypothetical protein ACFE04_000459 [Oxalis oulophora]
MGNSTNGDLCESPNVTAAVIPVPPPLPDFASTRYNQKERDQVNRSLEINDEASDLWDQLFDHAYRADVCIRTDNGGVVYAHANVLGIASDVLKGMLKQTKRFGRMQTISIQGVPEDAVRVFVRFLYSSRFEKEDMDEYALQLLVMSHVYVVPRLKRICECHLEHGLLITIDNVVDVFQIALLCDAPRLNLVSHRIIIKHLKVVSETEAWYAMKESHLALEQEILETVIDEHNREKNRVKRKNEKTMYLELYDAMEALVHICKEGCRTIGPHDQDFKDDMAPCKYPACKGLELLIRHFTSCKLRYRVGCIRCKRMRQLLELHTRLCAVESDVCRVPLCRNFKDRIGKESKKDDMRWEMLVKKILGAKRIGISHLFLSAN